MVFDGGGWTLILSTLPGHSINRPGDAGVDASSPFYYLRPPAPNELGMFKGEFVQPLAQASNQVHIRTPFPAGTGPDGGPAYVTSILHGDGGPSQPMTNLANLKLLNAGLPNGDYSSWQGPNATQARLSFSNQSNACTALNGEEYPHLYWACDNPGGLHISNASSRWMWINQTTPDEAMEVYVR